jgi:hypothetical protein
LAQAAAEAEDMLLVYYAGHGLTWTNRNDLYLALRNSRPHIAGTSALRCADIRQVFLDSRAATRVLILDCCFSGRAIEQSMANQADALLGGVDVDGAYILTATEGPQPALSPDGHRNTLFTGELLRALREGIPGGPELLTLDVLYQHLTAVLRRRNLPTPRARADSAAGQLALARNAATRGGGAAGRSARSGGEYRGSGDIGELQKRVSELERLREEHPGRLAELRSAIDALAAAEMRAAQGCRTALEKIADPGLVPPTPRAPALRDRLADLERLAAADQWTRLADGLTAVHQQVEQAARAAAALQEAADGSLDRRIELRGRLAVFLAMAVRLGVAEQAEFGARYAEAHGLLWTRPCDQRAATRAVLAYQRLVIERRELTQVREQAGAPAGTAPPGNGTADR